MNSLSVACIFLTDSVDCGFKIAEFCLLGSYFGCKCLVLGSSMTDDPLDLTSRSIGSVTVSFFFRSLRTVTYIDGQQSSNACLLPPLLLKSC
jgi:hypothetical protein